jgi:CHAT domain-containing protein
MSGMLNFHLKQMDKAMAYAKESLKYCGDDPDFKLSSHTLIGGIYSEGGDYGSSLKHYEMSLVFAEEYGHKEKISLSLRRLASVNQSLGESGEQVKYLLKALELDIKNKNDNGIAEGLLSLGECALSQEKFDEARGFLEKAEQFISNTQFEKRLGGYYQFLNIELGKYFEKRLNIDYGLLNIGLGKYVDAISIFNKEMKKHQSDPVDVQAYHDYLARAYYLKGDYVLADMHMSKAVEILEGMRNEKGIVDRIFFITKIKVLYELSISSKINQGKYHQAFQLSEKVASRGLGEAITENPDLKTVELSKIQSRLKQNQAMIIYPCNSYSWFHNPGRINMLVITNKRIHGIEKPKPNSDNMIMLIKSYHNALSQGVWDQLVKKRSKKLYSLLIKPLMPYLNEKNELTIISDGPYSLIPFETLLDENNQYLVENISIKYVQAATVWDLLGQRKSKQWGKDLLAFGGAIYEGTEQFDPTSVPDIKLQKYAHVINQIDKEQKSDGNFLQFYEDLGYNLWTDLNYSLEEVNTIAQLYNSDVHTGTAVTEKKVKHIIDTGSINQYKMVHFATHGLLDTMDPWLSAIVLSQGKDLNKKEDGYLQFKEISKRSINVDYVNLSACHTGAGAVVPGESTFGLVWAFMAAGVNAVNASLWSIQDKATPIYMESLYTKIQSGIGYGEANTLTKREFISGEYGDTYKNPYYWSPFIYYGR